MGAAIILPEFDYDGAPILVTEFGGVKVEEQQAEGWGYGQAAADYEEMLQRITGPGGCAPGSRMRS
ncbi:MAG: hypothetical protein ACOX3I_04200 [Limnochordia bacterium]